jgi:hypothetical protein
MSISSARSFEGGSGDYAKKIGDYTSKMLSRKILGKAMWTIEDNNIPNSVKNIQELISNRKQAREKQIMTVQSVKRNKANLASEKEVEEKQKKIEK